MKCRKLEFQFGNYSLLTLLLLVTCGESSFERALNNNGLFDPPEVTNFTDTDISPFEEADISQFKSEAESMQHIDNGPSRSETLSHEIDCGEKCSKDLERKENGIESSEHNEEPINISITSKENDVDTTKYGEQDSSFLMKTVENCTSLPSTCTRDDIHGAEAIPNTNPTTSLTDNEELRKLITSSNVIENNDASTNEHDTDDKIEASKSFSDSTSSISHTNSKENEESSSVSSTNATTQNLINQVLSNHLEFERPSSAKTFRTNDLDDPFIVPYLQQIIEHLTSSPSHNRNTSRKDNINETIPSSNTGEKVVLLVGGSNSTTSQTEINDKLTNSIDDSSTHSPHESISDDRNNLHPTMDSKSTKLPPHTTKTINHEEEMVEEDGRKAIKHPSDAHNPTTLKTQSGNENDTGQEETLNTSTSIHRKSNNDQPTKPSTLSEKAIQKLLGNNQPTISYHSTPGSTSTSDFFSTLDYISTKSSRRSTHTPPGPAQRHLTTHPPTKKHLTTHPQTQKHVTTHPPTKKRVTTHAQTTKHATTHPPTQKHATTHPQTTKHVTTHPPTQKHATPHRTTHAHTARGHKISHRPALQASYNVFDLSPDEHSTRPKLTEQSSYLQMQSMKPLKNYGATTTKHPKNVFKKPSKSRSHEPTYPTAFHPPFKVIFPQKTTTPVHPRDTKITDSVVYPPVSFDKSQQKNNNKNKNNNVEIGIPAAYAGCNGFEVTLCFGGEPYFNDSTATPTTEQYSKQQQQQQVPAKSYAFASNSDHTNMAFAVHSDMTQPLNMTDKPMNYGNYVLQFSTPTNLPTSPPAPIPKSVSPQYEVKPPSTEPVPKSVSSQYEAKPPSTEPESRTVNPTLQMIPMTSSSINLEFPTVMLPPLQDASSSVLVQLPPVLLIPGTAVPTQSAVTSRKAKTPPRTTSVPLESHEIRPLTTSSAKKKTFPLSPVKPQLSLHPAVESFHANPTSPSNVLIPLPLSPSLTKTSRSPPNAHASVHNSHSQPNAHASAHNPHSPPNAHASVHNSRSPPNAHASVHNSRPPPNAHASAHNSRSPPHAHASAQKVSPKKNSTIKIQHGKTKEICSKSNPSAACFDSIFNKASQKLANNQPNVSNIKAVTAGLSAAHSGGKNPLFHHLPYPARTSKHLPIVHHPVSPKKNVTKANHNTKPICSPKNPSLSCVHFYTSKEKGGLQKNLLSTNKTAVAWKNAVTAGKCVCRPSITKKPCACNCVKLGPFNVCKDPDVKDAFVYQHNS